MEGLDAGVLARMPLAEAVLVAWRFVASDERLRAVFDHHRGRCGERSISFATLVRLVADALVEHGGSGNQSFSRAEEAGELDATTRAVQRKLGRLPVVGARKLPAGASRAASAPPA